MIVGCLIVFECAATLGKTLKSIEPFVDRIIVVDGSYEGFSDRVRSEDGTMGIVRGFPKPRIEYGNSMGHPWRDQMRKRNQYLIPTWYRRRGAIPDTWILIIDGDEYVSEGAEETRDFLATSKEQYHRVRFQTPDGGKLPDRVRLLRYVEGMRYMGNHMTIEYPDGRTVGIGDKAPLAPLVIVHDQSKRTPEYSQAMKRYNLTRRREVEHQFPRSR